MEVKKLQMLPPGPGQCPICGAAAHDDDFPHNRDSLFYQVWFYNTNGRSPTWADASLRCSPATRRGLKFFLLKNNVPLELIGDLP